MEEKFFQINKTELNIGLKKSYKFFQISDMHMAYIDKLSSDVDKADWKRFHNQWDVLKYDFAKQFNELCDDRYSIEPNIIFERLCAYAVDIKADALILSGDIMDRVTESNIRYMKEFVKKYPLPIIYCLGNHAETNEYGEKGNQYHRFEGIINNPECDSFDFGEFEILSIDNGRASITDKQIDFLIKKISENKKLLLLVHKPLKLGEFGEKLSDKISPYFFMGVDSDTENTKKFVSLVKENADSFIGVLCGHIHTAQEFLISDNLLQASASSGLIGAGREIIIK